jgi:hypothetical protein
MPVASQPLVHRRTTSSEQKCSLAGRRRFLPVIDSVTYAGETDLHSSEDHLLFAGSFAYAYDLDGFLLSKTDGTDTTTYVYSSRGELLSVMPRDGTLIEHDHDPLGQRIAKRVNGVVTEKYLWSGLTGLLAVYDGSDNLLMRFEYAGGRMPIDSFHILSGNYNYD